MIKKLRIKFVCVVMAIATIMVSAILGIVIYFTLNGMEMQSMNMMMAVASAPFHKGLPGKMEEDQIRLLFLRCRSIGRDNGIL